MTEFSPIAIHQHTLSLFLRTDLHRLEAALEEKSWTTGTATRLTDHLRFAAHLQATILEGRDPRDQALRATVDAIVLESIDDALERLEQQTQKLIDRIAEMNERDLNATVVDPYERGLTALGHLYDFCRASAMLVEWARAIDESGPDEGTLAALTGSDPIVFP